MSLSVLEIYQLEDDLKELISNNVLYDINDMTLSEDSVIAAVKDIMVVLDTTIEMSIKKEFKDEI